MSRCFKVACNFVNKPTIVCLEQEYYLNIQSGSIAQLGEHLPYKQGVTGSSPVTSTIKQARAADGALSMKWS